MPALRARSNAANPLPVVWTSTSTTSTPEGVPVGIPRLASGQRRHHSRIVAPSVVASWKPWAVRGCFPPGAHGNTGTSWRGSIIEGGGRNAAPDRAVTSRGLHRGAGAFIGAELFMATPCIAARTNHRPRAPRPGRLRGPGRAVFPQVNPARERKATEFGGPCVKPPLEIQRTLTLPTTSGLLALHQPVRGAGCRPGRRSLCGDHADHVDQLVFVAGNGSACGAALDRSVGRTAALRLTVIRGEMTARVALRVATTG